MEQSKIIISRNSSIVGCLAKLKIELDGCMINELKDGETIEILTTEGIHTLKFFHFKNGKCQNSTDINITEENQTIHIVVKYNSNGKLELENNGTVNKDIITKTTKSSPKVPLVLMFIAILISVIILMFAIGLKSNITNTTDDNNSNEILQEQSIHTKERIIYVDDNTKITYLGLDDPKTGLTLFNMSLRLENYFDKNVLITLTDSYINDTAVQFIGGNPTLEGIKPNKKGICVFGFGYDKMGISKIEDISKIEFKIKLTNPDNYSEVLLETDTITLIKE